MNTRRIFLRNLLGDLFFFGIMHGIISTAAYGITRELLYSAEALLLALPLFLLMFARRKIRNVLLFVIFHAAVLLGTIFLPTPIVHKVFAIAFVVIAIIYSILVRRAGEFVINKPVAAVGCGINAAVVIFCEYMGLEAVRFIPIAWTFFMLLAHLIYTQGDKLDYSLSIEGDMRYPVRSIIRFNNFIILGFVALAAMVMFTAPFLKLDGIIAVSGSILSMVLRGIVALFQNISVGETEEVPMPKQDTAMRLPPAESSAFMEAIGHFFYVAAVFLLIAAAVILAVYGLYKLYHSFFESKNVDGDLREYAGPPPLIEQLKKGWKNIISRTPAFSDDNAGKIRRMYYKRVSRQIKRGAKIKPADTVNEICEKLGGKEDIEVFTDLYNQARYGLEAPKDISKLRGRNGNKR
jgi:hypothetical protein